jgi:hypothetical protein
MTMKITASSNSKFLKKEDAPQPKLFTVRDVIREKVGEDQKFIMYFEEEEKGLVLNKTNIVMASDTFGSDDSDNWVGRKIVLYTDPKVQDLNGNIVGGLRLRPTKQDLEKKISDVPF